MGHRQSRAAAWILAATVLAGCSSTSPTEALDPDPAVAVVTKEKGQTFQLKMGETANIGSGQLIVGFREVKQDSRCPSDVTCVWQGDAEVVVQVTVGRMAWTNLTLHTGVEPHSGTFRENTITLLEVNPGTRSDRQIRDSDYVVTLRVD